MNSVYTCTSFAGHYPVGVAAVIVAANPQRAADLLNYALIEKKLDGDVKPEDMIKLCNTPDGESGKILNDGNY
jgi:hypothetical protein